MVCYKCGDSYDESNRLMNIRHEQGFCVTCPSKKKYQKRNKSTPPRLEPGDGMGKWLREHGR